VFDCDKTLITGDIGEASLRRALKQRWVVSHDAWWRHLDEAEIATPDERKAWRRVYEREATAQERPAFDQVDSLSDELWRAYEDLCQQDITSAYVYAARFTYHRTQAEVTKLAHTALSEDSMVRLRPLMWQFVNQLQVQGGQVWVVSSSHIDVIRVIAQHYHISSNQLIGIDFMRQGPLNYSSENLIQPIPINTGKVTALFKYQEARPTLMVGDSFHDLPLMATATHRFLIDHHQSDDVIRAALALDAHVIDHHLVERDIEVS